MSDDVASLDALLPLVVSGDAGDSLLPPSATWEGLWRDMPAYEMGDTEAVQKIIVHFRSREDVEEFKRLLGDHIYAPLGAGINGEKIAGSMWFDPEKGRISPRELIYTADHPITLRYPIYIPSKGRWETPYTARALKAIGVSHRVVVEPAEFDDYARALGIERLLVLPEDFSKTKRSGSIPARNWIWDHAVAEGYEKHWIIDDNVKGFLRTNRNRRIPVSDGAIFCAAEDFTDRYENVALSGFQYMYFVNERSDSQPPIYLNTRVYSMILVNHALPHRWRGRYNEDTDLSLRALKDGWCTIVFNAFLGDKTSTLITKGGNTDTIYATGDKRRAFAESLAEQHPDVARVVWRYNRWHHEVDYRPFVINRLRERPGWRPPDDPEYGMKLVRRVVTTRYPQPQARAVAPVVLTPKGSATPPGAAPTSTENLFDLVAPPPRAQTAGSASIDPELITLAAEHDASHEPAHTILGSVSTELMAAAMPIPAVAAPRAVTLAPRGQRTTGTITLRAPQPREAPDDPFLAAHARTLRLAGRARIAFDEAAWDHAARDAVGLDCEVFKNFFCCCLKRFSDGRRMAFELSVRSDLDADGLRAAIEHGIVVTFNGNGYDLPVVAAALDGASNGELYEISQDIIVRGQRRASPMRLDHVDLMNVAPTRQSLKMLHGRLHGGLLVDLPYSPDAELTPEQMNVATLYCMNDLDATGALREALREALALRAGLGRDVGRDLRSRSDAQVGEALVLRRVERITGVRPRRADGPSPGPFRYAPPAWLRFGAPGLVDVVAQLRDARFEMVGDKIQQPRFLDGLVVKIGAADYAMGVGGLHSREERRAVRADERNAIIDLDVSSQYPMIIANLGMHPPGVGPEFAGVYRAVIEERLEAKAALAEADGDERARIKAKVDALKIASNGVFGKLGSCYSPLYAPEMLLATTLTGQLSLLMLIERLEAAGIAAISGNTDGVTSLVPRAREPEFDRIVAEWEAASGFACERTRYSALYSRDVNTYIALKEGGGVKRKGWIANPWSDGDVRGQLSKNPQMTVVGDAAVAHLRDGVPVAEHVGRERDPRAFVTLIKVKDGGVWRGSRLGRAVRWYWSIDGDPIVYADSGRRVGKTEGARPLMQLGDRCPDDLDRALYVAEAERLLVDIGAREAPRGEGLL